MVHGPPNAQAVQPCHACPADDESAFDEAAFLQLWDRDIRRAAAAGARRLRSAAVDTDDLAQAARYQLLRAIRRHRITSTGYIRRLIRNAILSVLRHEARRRDGDLGRRVELTEDLPAQSPEPPDNVAARVTAWITTLPDRLQHVYHALYVHRLTQRNAARRLGISQPRVAQLHAVILEQGRRALPPVAA